MTMFPERQEAVKVLYKAAAQLLDDAADSDTVINRDLNRLRADNCLLLAEKIGGMQPLVIHVDGGVVTEVKDIPFSLGFVVRDPEQEKVGEIIDPDFEVEDEPNAKS